MLGNNLLKAGLQLNIQQPITRVFCLNRACTIENCHGQYLGNKAAKNKSISNQMISKLYLLTATKYETFIAICHCRAKSKKTKSKQLCYENIALFTSLFCWNWNCLSSKLSSCVSGKLSFNKANLLMQRKYSGMLSKRYFSE